MNWLRNREAAFFVLKIASQLVDTIIEISTTNRMIEFWIQVLVQIAIKRLKFSLATTAIIAFSSLFMNADL